MCFEKLKNCVFLQNSCQLSFSRLLLDTEKNSETENISKKRKYKVTEKFLREITLEENIELESELNKKEKSQTKIKLYQCSKCEKNYKFASGLHYHTKHNHRDEECQQLSQIVRNIIMSFSLKYRTICIHLCSNSYETLD